MSNDLESAVHQENPSIAPVVPEEPAAVAADAEAPQVKDTVASARPGLASCCGPECCR